MRRGHAQWSAFSHLKCPTLNETVQGGVAGDHWFWFSQKAEKISIVNRPDCNLQILVRARRPENPGSAPQIRWSGRCQLKMFSRAILTCYFMRKCILNLKTNCSQLNSVADLVDIKRQRLNFWPSIVLWNVVKLLASFKKSPVRQVRPIPRRAFSIGRTDFKISLGGTRWYG